ncbi:hypothetical protein [Rhizobium leguminosarum]|uniref:hypothetical protein n=1 Tax=Rhizobium leguminosarum TaxID=384 RepID=UPI0004B16F99|nr:hypothetical protein [Rhizobium leguminosarum]
MSSNITAESMETSITNHAAEGNVGTEHRLPNNGTDYDFCPISGYKKPERRPGRRCHDESGEPLSDLWSVEDFEATMVVADLAAELVKLDPPRITRGNEKFGSPIIHCDYDDGLTKEVRRLTGAIRKRSFGPAAERTPPTPQDIGAFLTTAERYGYWITPPSDNEAVVIFV